MFQSFISYGIALKLFTIIVINTNQLIINFNPNTTFYCCWHKFYLLSFCGNISWSKINQIYTSYYFKTPNFINYLFDLTRIIMNLNDNKIIDPALLLYLKFYNNYLNYLKLLNKNFLISTNIVDYGFNKNLINFNYIYTYTFKNISNIFMYNLYKHVTYFNVFILISALLLNIYVFSVYRLSIIWYLGIIILIKLLLIFFFITNILRISKKIYIILYFFLLAYLVNLFLYNEVNIEYINTISLNICCIFAIIILFFFYKYNLFFLIFLELSITAGKSLSYVFKQYCRDVLNILAYMLRIFLLFIRLNIYDGLDDFFDSYYIFIGDFNSYDYSEIIYLYTYSIIPSSYDNLYDKSILNYEETEIYLNIIYLYTIILFKFLIFLILLLEGGFRLLLASYIFILVILEINNFNVIFLEHKN